MTFLKRDELTTDLVCCEIGSGGKVFWFHEEMPGWDQLMTHVAQLPGFRSDWRDAVILPPFAENRTVAFEAVT